MYESHNIATAIKERAGSQGVVLKSMLVDLNLGSNTMSSMYHGKSLSSDSLARIADYLDCSVDYLLGRSNQPTIGNDLPEETKRLITAFASADEGTRASVRKLLDL